MDLLTITDHDSIEAAEACRSRKNFFLSEEVSCTTPGGTLIHVGVYGIQEGHHQESQKRRTDLISFVEYLHEQKLFFSINHAFSHLTGRRTEHDFALFEKYFPAVEVLNGQMLACCNRSAAEFARSLHKLQVAGSDAHTLTSLGTVYTEVPGARNSTEYLAGLHSGFARVSGSSGNYWTLTRAVLEIGIEMIRERPATAALSPLFAAVPFVTLVNVLSEIAFAHKWIGKIRANTRHYEGVQSLVESSRA
ncbi:MAG TPA: PHP-associated domain-containing protein [Bryobacteraceae bacterium]|nr:PHP-associated domain-containing protein [Bryobacteraceae bacterium]